MKKMDQMRLLPDIQEVRKMSDAWCAVVFDELNTVINFIVAGKRKLNSTQRRLLERFSLGAVEFAHDMLLAGGRQEEIERRLAVSSHNQRLLYVEAMVRDPSFRDQPLPPGAPVALRLYEEVPADLRKIQTATLDDINDGIWEIIRGISDEQTLPDTLEREALKDLAAAVKDLQIDIDQAFRVRFGIMEALKGQYAARIDSISAEAGEASEGSDAQVTVDDFMSRVSPPQKPLNARGCLAPFFHDIAKLRTEGYTWKQVCEFLQQNGVVVKQAGAVSMHFQEWIRKEN